MQLANMSKGAGEAFTKELARLGKDSEKIGKQVVMAGASPVADEIRKNLEENLKDHAFAGIGDGDLLGGKRNMYTGDLLESFGIAPPSMDQYGKIDTKIGFAGYDRKGVPNALKARAMESGTSWLRKRPFVRPAVNKTRGKSQEAMISKLDEAIKIYAL